MQSQLPPIRIVVLSLAVFLCGATILVAQEDGAQEDFVFTTIVNPETLVPGGVGTFNLFFPFGSVAVDRGEVIFTGRSADRIGVYWFRQGTLERVVDTTMLFPGTATTFSFFPSTAIDNGEIAFSGSAVVDVEGVFLDDGTSLQTIADHTDLIPDTFDLFTNFGHVDLHQGELVFGGGNQSFSFTRQAGLYSTVGGLHTLFDQGDEIPPGGMGNFPAFGNVAFDDNGVAFAMPRISSSVNDGIYKDVGAGLEVVADLTTPIPGGSGNFDGFRNMDYSDGNVAFIATGPSAQFGIYSDQGGGLQVLVDTSTPVPGGGNFSSYANLFAFSNGNVAFTGFGPGVNGAFAVIDGVLLEIVRQGDSLDGRTVDQMLIYRGGMDDTAIAVDIQFTDSTSGIYLAELPMFTDDFESGTLAAWASCSSC